MTMARRSYCLLTLSLILGCVFLSAIGCGKDEPKGAASRNPTPGSSITDYPDPDKVEAFATRVARAAHLAYTAGKTKNFQESVATQTLMVNDLKTIARDIESDMTGLDQTAAQTLIAEMRALAEATKALVDCRKKTAAGSSCKVLGGEYERRFQTMIAALTAFNSYGGLRDFELKSLIETGRVSP